MNAPLPRDHVTLEDKFHVEEGWIYVTGTQALTRLPIQQHLRDRRAGLKTGGFISGYRGSPMGRYDMELWAQSKLLAEHDVHFQPGVNEELAASSIIGSQFVGLMPGSKFDGVFGIWYGKGPGTDRAADAFRHGNVTGAHAYGGVVALAGDDHGCKSSSVYNFSDQTFIATGIPVLYPSNTQELLDFGLHGFAMSRFSGCWVGMKIHNDVVEGGGSVRVSPDAPKIVLPDVPAAPHLGPEGRNARVADMPLVGEERLYQHKLPAALAYARANGLNRIVHDVPGARIGVFTAGKSYEDVMQAFNNLGLSEAKLHELGVRVGKVGMVWPLDPDYVTRFAEGLDVVLVVEEKRPLLEEQLKSILYDLPLARKPRVVGKHNGAQAYAPERGATALPNWGELSPPLIAQAFVELLRGIDPSCALPVETLPSSGESSEPGVADAASPTRKPGFCSGCPHNRSTRVPDGSRAIVGIGCHAMAALNDPAKTPPTFTQMGGEGTLWVGQHRFTEEKHVFANMGDGTYYHSGLLAIRQALASKAPMTYKILVNGFVSMTGGQPIEGEILVPDLVAELKAEGVREITVVTDEVDKYPRGRMPVGVPVLHRSQMDAVMLRYRDYPGLSVIVYDQPCATERRRLRKRGKWADPLKRTFINAAVCEGCGDCSKASNCMSIEPLATPFGRKRQINQSSCNKDFSCIDGFCPSFVTVHGGKLRSTRAAGAGLVDFPPNPEPTLPTIDGTYSVLITGVGGTGVVTIGQVLGMAAHVDGLATSVLDVTGLAQKYGAVMSHLRFARTAEALHATRIAAGEADAVIGCDLVVTAGDEALARMRNGHTRVVVATDLVPTTDFSRNPDWQLDGVALFERIRERCASPLLGIDALRIASALMGDAVAANMFLLGAAWQSGAVPLSHAAIMKAIELNKTQVESNKASFLWGRRAVVNRAAVEKAATSGSVVQVVPRIDMSLAAVVKRSIVYLTEYQDEAYAQRYKALVDRAVAAERAKGLGEKFSIAVARYYFKLLAIKDEFEVARLHSGEAFRSELQATFEGNYTLRFHVGAWPFGGVDRNGKPHKKEVGPWLMSAFRVLAKLKRLRGTVFDVYRNNPERRLNLRVLADYEREVNELIASLDSGSHALATELASLPEKIRGYGHVREAHVAAVERERAKLKQLAPWARVA
ncbi:MULTISPECIES: indolepyruvate ferredoxin oxidoreductase family protein [Paraburkholderia]|uniref:Indolepyruvate ferredoxin oxidoreductase family protein n=1 Tax=Paraburkholderia metrosideri TaxID=580937 RepID=A0ABW9E3U7_9BURK